MELTNIGTVQNVTAPEFVRTATEQDNAENIVMKSVLIDKG